MIILIAIEAILKPRIDITSEQEVLLFRVWNGGNSHRLNGWHSRLKHIGRKKQAGTCPHFLKAERESNAPKSL